ncbi:MAG: hypothetical protein U0325_03200 [Polyangiales bacterium]
MNLRITAIPTILPLLLAACSSTPSAPATSDVPPARDVVAPTDTGNAPADAGDEFANAPECNINGFMRLQGASFMNETPPSSVLVAGRPMLTNAAGPSSLTLTNEAGSTFLLRFEWSGMLRADQPAALTGAQIFLPMDQGMSAPPLDGPWADKRICAGAGSRVVLRRNGMQFILRNATVTSGACPGGDAVQGDTLSGCYIPNVAP